jgi:hypothetical protein
MTHQERALELLQVGTVIPAIPLAHWYVCMVAAQNLMVKAA